MLDIEHFTPINDTYGHAAGDTALVELVKILQPELRETDLIGRIGGDEFSIFLPKTSHADALDIYKRINKKINESKLRIEISEYF